LGEFNQIHNFGATGNNDELIRFGGQKVKKSKVEVLTGPRVAKKQNIRVDARCRVQSTL